MPSLLRAAGLRLVTLSERYGIPTDETVPDHRWLGEAGARGEAVLMKDARIRYQPAEKAAVVAHAVRCFCLTGGNLSADDMAACFLDNLDAVTAAWKLGRSCSPCSAAGSSTTLTTATPVCSAFPPTGGPRSSPIPIGRS
ncbi:MAG: hypothetical protein ACRDY7_18135, partial [Acidimicrobiia bacterium]